MKKIFKHAVIIVTLVSLTTSINAQIIARPTPLWVSSKGYWVVENNIHSKANVTIRYYNNDHVLILTEYVQNKKMNLKDREVKIKLKEDLESALIQWEFNQQAAYMERNHRFRSSISQ